ncbi:MAG: aminotransferase class V-fold PLP-dependent enzyme [Bacteroidetes bacterium]|nr:aminotransferase class V-fold PLP-dependent enzyme [Bacteroidota bacterium]
MQHLKSQFLLNPEITYLNFGSFGACPKPIFEDYIRWQYLLESEPVQFIAFDGAKYLQQAREALSQYINCEADDLVLVTNPSYAVNAIAKSFPLQAGDEILTTSIEYGACDKTWNYYCKKAGAIYRRHPVSFPIESSEQIVEDFFKEVTANTKLIFISHITSSTALILPVAAICKRAKQLGIPTFVDGAHAPGQIPLNLRELDADYYTGACHKWMMTPKGCSFIYVRKSLQAAIDPLIISWGYDSAQPGPSQFLDYHQMNGTRDFSAMLTIPKAIAFMQENNWEAVAQQCRKMAQENAPRFCELLQVEPLCPITDEFIGQLYSTRLQLDAPELFQRMLFERYRIEVPMTRLGNETFIRYSINAFNTQEDLDHLYEALKTEVSR